MAPILLLALILATIAGSTAQVVAQTTSTGESYGSLLDSATVNVRLDSLLPGLLDRYRVPGAVVTVMEGNRIVALKGTGRTNLTSGVVVSPERSVFRVASVSKTLTATLLRTLDAHGLIVLDEPVGRGVVDRDAADSVTIAHLLAHTSGLDGRLLGAGSSRPPASLRSVVRRRLPPQIDPAGAVSRYSNEGYTWAAAEAEHRVGQTFAELADSLLFEPLRMTRSTFAPGAGAYADARVTGYASSEKGFDPLPHDYVTMAPAGGAWTTGRDMARFLSAVLSDGWLEEERVLPREAVSFERGDMRDAFAGRRGHLGWFQRTVSGHRAFVHDGTYPGAGSQLVVFPGLDLGVFVAGNASTAVEMAKAVTELVLQDVDAPTVDAPETISGDLATLDGTYRIARRPHTSFEAAFALLGVPYPDVEVEARGDTAITVGLADGALTLLHKGDLRFAASDGSVRESAAVVSGAGPVPRIQVGAATFERIPFLAERALGLAWLIVCLLAYSSVFVLPVREFFRPGSMDDDNAAEGMQYARPLATFAAALHIGFLFALGFRLLTGGPLGPTHTDPASIQPLLAFPIMASVLSLALVIFVVRAWTTSSWSQSTRVHFSIVTAGLIAYIPWLWYWNLIGIPVA
ncbi:serine hydrolase domain-containing protein [Longibacter salinarum]|uniref:serine hydrolase domain-containing protein n=1 Tax=Longibacter salinarum TaxID=1850348 RepID=UPI0015CF25B4|nr:serine hydrolase domain-containing protein [Longibacter salinarum]